MGHQSCRHLLASNLRRWRVENGLLLKQIALELDTSVSTVSSWEHARRFPSPEHLDRMARFVGWPVCRLLYDGQGNCRHTGED